ncbi:hypothetical protein XENOCAPTIV_018047 [Xenoophorus captivus]|uniref:RNA binding motif protein 15 n=1 Tax=Xenoophorus captivus TaxID=1517983 RepID=A0ABV0RHW8_9TELE
MKGKERSPVKKRTRGPDDGRDRGGSYPSSKKTTTLSASNGSAHSSASTRRGLPSDKRDMRDSDGHGSSSRTGSGYDYGASSVNKLHGGADIAAENSRSGPRSDPRPPSAPGSEYKTLKISELGSELNDEEIEDGLFHEFKKFGDVSVKICRENHERVAFVNFRRPEDARAAKHARGKLVLYDRPLKIETVYMNKHKSHSPISKDSFSSGHRHIHSQRPQSPPSPGFRDYRLQQLALGRLPAPPPPPPPPLPPHLRDLERDRDFPLYEGRRRPPFIPECSVFREEELLSPEDDQRANRTLFLGNLEAGLTENDIRRVFERFGLITEVDIKRAVGGQNSTYGFIKFENLDMAHRAKVAMSGKVMGHSTIKIGYGKPTPTTRLWVGGLGPWVPLAALAKEFDRFGTIRTIAYRKGDSWAYIQYESLDAAHAAWTHMRGFPLGGPDRRLRVDFAETENRYPQQQFMQLPLPLPHFDLVPKPFSHRLAEPMRVRDRTPPFPGRFRERDPYSSAEWAALNAHDRMREPGFDPIDRLERRSREGWSAERELQCRDLGLKRRHLDDGWRVERSPDNGDFGLRRHCNSLERSPGGSSRDGGHYSDPERLPRSGRTTPAKERQNNHNAGFLEKRKRTCSPSQPDSITEKESKRKAGDTSKSLGKKEQRPENPASNPSPSKSGQHPKSSADGLKLSQAWEGVLLLKNSSFPASLHLLDGDMRMATTLLVEGSTGGRVSQLKISQRLRLDQPKLDEIARRIKAAGSSGYTVLLAVPGKTEDANSSMERPLKNLVSYLKQKEAAGIISLPVGGGRDKEHNGVLHAFPPCEFSQQFVDDSAKAFAKSEEDYLVIIIIKGAS